MITTIYGEIQVNKKGRRKCDFIKDVIASSPNAIRDCLGRKCLEI